MVVAVEAKRVDLEFDLVDQEGGLVARAHNGGPGAGERLSVDLPSGVYYVRVRASGAAGCDPYRVSLGFAE